MRIDTTLKPPMARASFALFFAAMSVLLLLLLVTYVYVFSARGYELYCEDLTLPYARAARIDESPEPERLAICIHRDGTLCVSGRPVTDEDIRILLLREARLTRNVDGISERTVLLAADEGAPFKSIKKIVELCGRRNIRIWRLSFATRPAADPGAVWRWR
jgi:biopolymer transport protein ExbD